MKFSFVKKNGYNSLDKDSQINIKKKLFNKNGSIIKKHIGLNNSFISNFFFSSKEINFSEKKMDKTEYTFCKKPMKSPSNLNLITKIILNKKFNQDGLFRVNSTGQRLKTATALLYDILEERVHFDKGQELFNKNFDLVDCCELYKELLRSFNTPVIPNKFISNIILIPDIEDREIKIICCKAIFYSIPYINRVILENNIYFCYKVVEKTEKLKNAKKQLDLDGISTVMMPNLFLKENQNIEIESVLKLVEFYKFFTKNFIEIMEVSE